MMYSNFFNLHFFATRFDSLRQLIVLILPVLFLLSCQSENSNESDTKSSLPEEINSDQEIGVYELRTYYASEGNLENLLSRFRDHTLLLFEKHEMKNIAYWVPTQNNESGRVTTMKNAVQLVKAILVEDDGASMVEYAIGVAFIAALLVVALALFTGKLNGVFTSINGKLDTAAGQ